MHRLALKIYVKLSHVAIKFQLFRLDYSLKRESSLMQGMYADHKSFLNFFLFLHSIKLNCLFRAGFRLHKKLLHSYIYFVNCNCAFPKKKRTSHRLYSLVRSLTRSSWHGSFSFARTLILQVCLCCWAFFICIKTLEFRIVISFSDFN